MKAIELRDITFSYGRRKRLVLKGITLSCEEGTVNTLIGLNGCGKTTLIRILAGLEKPASGTIAYFDHDISELSDFKERSKIISYVPQNFGAIGDYTVRDYLLFGTANRLDFYESPSNDEEEIVEKQVDRFGIRHLYSKKLGELSGGERQIVSICSVMAQDSKIIILDEPCSALDIVNQDKVLAILKDIAAECGKTILLSTHNPNHALFLDAQVFLLKDGIIIDSGKASEIAKPERLKPIYGEKVCYSRDLQYNEISFGNLN